MDRKRSRATTWATTRTSMGRPGRTWRVGLVVAALLFAGACASSGSGRASSLLREDLGRQMAYRMNDAQIEFWGKHQIPLFRSQIEPQALLFESQWMPRDIPAEEVSRGVFEARNRVIIRGRAIEQSLDPNGTLYRVTFEVENQVRSEITPEWHPAPFPDTVRARFRALYEDMNLELNTGIRR